MEGGKRKAVLAGCNYPTLPALLQLHGCIYDVHSMKEVLIAKFGFKENDIEVFTDEPNSSNMPTRDNIKGALNGMVKGAQEGDLLFFYFSGHGTFTRSRDHGKKHEAIIPSDLLVITDVEFTEIVAGIHHKATFTMLSDSCYSGGLMDQEKVQIGPEPNTCAAKPENSKSFRRKFIPIDSILDLQPQTVNTGYHPSGFHLATCLMTQPFRNDVSPSCGASFPLNNYRDGKAYHNGVLMSGCQSDEYSQEDQSTNPPHGVFTYAVLTALKKAGHPVSNKQLVKMTRELLQGGPQHPCLYCSDENADATFLLQRQLTTN